MTPDADLTEPGRRRRGRPFYGWAMVVVGALIAFSSGPGQSFIFSVFIDSMIEDTGFSRATISGLYTLSTGLSAAMVMVVSRLADRVGVRVVLVVVGVLLTGACFGMAGAGSFVTFFASFSALRALGQGSLTINATLLVNQWFVARRGQALALMGLGFPLSNAVLPPLCRVLIDSIGWRETYAVLGVIVFVLVVPPAILLVRNRPEDVGRFPDGADHPPPSEQAADAAGASGDEASAPEPERDRRRVLTSLTFWLLAAPLATPGLVMTALIFHQTSVFAEHGLSATLAAAVFPIIALSSALTSLVAGFVVDRTGPVRLFIGSMVGMLAVMGMALVINSAWQAIVYAAGVGVVGGSLQIVGGVIWAHYYGRRGLGRVQGSAMMIMITGAAVGPLPLALFRDATDSYAVGIVVMMVLPVLSIASVIAARPERRLAVAGSA